MILNLLPCTNRKMIKEKKNLLKNVVELVVLVLAVTSPKQTNSADV